MSIKVGDIVQLTPAMSVDGYRVGKVSRVDGFDIYVDLIIDGEIVTVHRYASEMERITSV